MSEQAIKFLQEWIGEKCQAPAMPARIDEQAHTLARECTKEAAQAGIPLEDIQEEVGDIQELIALHLEDAAEADGPEPQGSTLPADKQPDSKAQAETGPGNG